MTGEEEMGQEVVSGQLVPANPLIFVRLGRQTVRQQHCQSELHVLERLQRQPLDAHVLERKLRGVLVQHRLDDAHVLPLHQFSFDRRVQQQQNRVLKIHQPKFQVRVSMPTQKDLPFCEFLHLQNRCPKCTLFFLCKRPKFSSPILFFLLLRNEMSCSRNTEMYVVKNKATSKCYLHQISCGRQTRNPEPVWQVTGEC